MSKALLGRDATCLQLRDLHYKENCERAESKRVDCSNARISTVDRYRMLPSRFIHSSGFPEYVGKNVQVASKDPASRTCKCQLCVCDNKHIRT